MFYGLMQVLYDMKVANLLTRWRAYMILKPIPMEERPMLALKIYTADALKSQRQEWGSGRKWLGNYLAQVTPILSPVIKCRSHFS